MAKKKSGKLIVIILLLVIVVGAGVYSVSVMSRPASEIDPSRLTTVQRGDLARSVVAIGKIEPISKVEIKSKANGIIKEIKVQIGDIVQEGQAVVITFLGGLLGLLMSYILVTIIPARPFLAEMMDDPSRATDIHLLLSAHVAALATSILMVIGLLSGLWPALRAARMDPIESLRYE